MNKQKAINRLKANKDMFVFKETKQALDMAIEALNERPKGEWIPVSKVYRTTEADFPATHVEWETATDPDDVDAVRCSECGEVFDFEDARNWCSECGADMRGDKE